MASPRTTARVAGVLYFVTHLTSVGAVALYGGSAFDPEAPLAGRTSVLTDGLLEVILAAAVVGSAAALFPEIPLPSGAGNSLFVFRLRAAVKH